MGNLKELVEYFIPQFFCNYSPENPNFLLDQAEKARLYGEKKASNLYISILLDSFSKP
ncbi:MAG: hypothetical protein F6K22_06135 [Okeania sp. SIO2F4]|uniref:hypothetical protein n=1 Tax=Okeania sp. SIO2F4 TaxID=2607790 RepID=UPI001428F708|nr:hypothetical protein [Okeania sp. SIO2F4]NES02456.1 hypothetical protein [Okeania sp. SIO2F4]